MSDIPDSVLVALRNRERELELEAIAVRARIEEVREAIDVVEHAGRRRGRPRKSAIIEIPQRVAGGVADSETDEQLFPEGDAA